MFVIAQHLFKRSRLHSGSRSRRVVFEGPHSAVPWDHSGLWCFVWLFTTVITATLKWKHLGGERSEILLLLITLSFQSHFAGQVGVEGCSHGEVFQCRFCTVAYAVDSWHSVLGKRLRVDSHARSSVGLNVSTTFHGNPSNIVVDIFLSKPHANLTVVLE